MERQMINTISDEALRAELKRREAEKTEARQTYKKLVDEQVSETIKDLQLISAYLQKEKLNVFEKLKTLLDLKREIYKIKETQQSHSFSDKKGNTITYGFRTLDSWDDTVNSGIAKVRNFIESLAKDEQSKKLITLVNSLLKKDAKGNLKANRVLELSKLEDNFNNEDFSDGVNIIRQAYKPVKSVYFIDASSVDAQGKKHNIPLSMSSVDFPHDTNVDELFYSSEIYNNTN